MACTSLTLTFGARSLHNDVGAGRAGYVRLRKTLDENLQEPPLLVLAQAWIWNNRDLKIGLREVPHLHLVLKAVIQYAERMRTRTGAAVAPIC